jgi:hypothetical protein
MIDDFETFKASREKEDPSSRKMSEHQWQQAYVAYVNTRKRGSSGGKRGSSSSGGRRSRRASPASGSSANPVALMAASELRNAVRASSAYADLRLVVNMLAWVAIGTVVLAAAVKLVYYTNVSAALVALLNAVVGVVGIVGLRLLIHVVIDIPDIALHQRLGPLKAPDYQESKRESREAD